jgi:RNA polymerase sigma-70 factor (ECF subfamily)
LALRYGSGRRAWAEDVTHDVFVSLLESIERLDRDEELGGWLYRVTTRKCMTKLERERSRLRALMRWFVGGPSQVSQSPEAAVDVRREVDLVVAAFDELAPKERAAFSMYHLDGMDQAAIATVLGHSKGYVSKLIKRAEERIATATRGGPP